MDDLIKRADAVAAYMARRMGGSEEVIAAINAIPSHAEAQAANAIHSCHPDCDRPLCVLQRKAEAQASALEVAREALERIGRLRPAGDLATAKNTRALVQQMEGIALSALAQLNGVA